MKGEGGSGLSLYKKDFELGVGGEGRDRSRHFKGGFGPCMQYCPYKFHCFMELLKMMKFRQPISLQELFLPTRRMNSEGMIIPRVRLEKSKNNFVFKASTVWNKLQQYVFSRSESDSNGVIVPGFSTHSDLSISICIAKVRLKSYLFTYQMSGDPITWS